MIRRISFSSSLGSLSIITVHDIVYEGIALCFVLSVAGALAVSRKLHVLEFYVGELVIGPMPLFGNGWHPGHENYRGQGLHTAAVMATGRLPETQMERK